MHSETVVTVVTGTSPVAGAQSEIFNKGKVHSQLTNEHTPQKAS